MTALGVEPYRDSSLATGRDCLVKMGNGATSARQHFFDFQGSRSRVLDFEVMNVIFSVR